MRTLSKVAAERVARHLVAAGRLVDDDPQAALAQARAARALGSRVAAVREAVGETAYAAGEWAEAIAELRTARRMTGDDVALPLLADAERALGRPDRALRLAQSPEAQALPPAEGAEMRIVESGARRDLGQLDAALATLQGGGGLDRRSVRPWSPRLWYAYADTLLELGRTDEARDWFLAAAAADRDGLTDADERVLELDGVEVLADDDELAEENGPADDEGPAGPDNAGEPEAHDGPADMRGLAAGDEPVAHDGPADRQGLAAGEEPVAHDRRSS
ncbi:MAG TPA: tetratricopeptide repeat protein [Mycobacteriales bacterium]|nr:tetratricopeptide repeat protein [Mycobacteriales bacterium]